MVFDSSSKIIGHMWINYYSFSDEEKHMSKNTVQEMKSFSRKNFIKIVKGKYSTLTKTICLLSQTDVYPVMWSCYYLGKLRQALRNDKYQMFK